MTLISLSSAVMKHRNSTFYTHYECKPTFSTKRNKLEVSLCKCLSFALHAVLMTSLALAISFFLCCVILDTSFGSNIPLSDREEPAWITHVRKTLWFSCLIFVEFHRIVGHLCLTTTMGLETKLYTHTIKELSRLCIQSRRLFSLLFI